MRAISIFDWYLKHPPHSEGALGSAIVFPAVKFMEVNAGVHAAISELSLPTVDVFTVPGTESGANPGRAEHSAMYSGSVSLSSGEPSLSGQMMFPPGFKSSGRYPVLVYVYGGPDSQLVSSVSSQHSLFEASSHPSLPPPPSPLQYFPPHHR